MNVGINKIMLSYINDFTILNSMIILIATWKMVFKIQHTSFQKRTLVSLDIKYTRRYSAFLYIPPKIQSY